VIYHKNDDYKAERLAYHVIAYPNVLHRYEYFVDAQNGAILDNFSASCSFAGHRHEGEKHLENADFTIENHPNTEGVQNCGFEMSDVGASPKSEIRTPKSTFVDGKFTATAIDLLGVSRTINTYQVQSNRLTDAKYAYRRH
jgi:hypothetical protein